VYKLPALTHLVIPGQGLVPVPLITGEPLLVQLQRVQLQQQPGLRLLLGVLQQIITGVHIRGQAAAQQKAAAHIRGQAAAQQKAAAHIRGQAAAHQEVAARTAGQAAVLQEVAAQSADQAAVLQGAVAHTAAVQEAAAVEAQAVALPLLQEVVQEALQAAAVPEALDHADRILTV